MYMQVWDLFRGWEVQGFATPEVDFPFLEFEVYIENSAEVPISPPAILIPVINS